MVYASSFVGLEANFLLRKANRRLRGWTRLVCAMRGPASFARTSQAADASSQQPSPQGKISQMARGWESKSVEQQQEEMLEQRKTVRPPISPEEQQRNRKREGLLLSRKRLTQQLQAAGNPRHRQILEQAIAELDNQLSSFE